MRALRGKKVSFDKVIKMVADMVTLLCKEQVDDDSKKDMCEILIDKAEDDMKTFDVTISDLEKSIEDSTREIATITDEIAANGSRSWKKMWPSRWTCTRRSISIRLFEHHVVRGAIEFLFITIAPCCMLLCGVCFYRLLVCHLLSDSAWCRVAVILNFVHVESHFVHVFCIFACCAEHFGLIGVLC